jgi:hypothetical protein
MALVAHRSDSSGTAKTAESWANGKLQVLKRPNNPASPRIGLKRSIAISLRSTPEAKYRGLFGNGSTGASLNQTLTWRQCA